MFNLVSLIIGFVALVCAVVAFLPLLGWLNWLIIPLAIIGAAVGLISRGSAGRNLHLLVILLGVVRLILGGGVLCAATAAPTPISRRLNPSRGRRSRGPASAFP